MYSAVYGGASIFVSKKSTSRADTVSQNFRHTALCSLRLMPSPGPLLAPINLVALSFFNAGTRILATDGEDSISCNAFDLSHQHNHTTAKFPTYRCLFRYCRPVTSPASGRTSPRVCFPANQKRCQSSQYSPKFSQPHTSRCSQPINQTYNGIPARTNKAKPNQPLVHPAVVVCVVDSIIFRVEPP